MRHFLCALTIVGGLSALCAVPARAVEQAEEFLKALEDKGYGEAGADYMEQLKAEGKVPPAMQEAWDLEMAKCLTLSVKEAFSKGEAEERAAKASELRKKFIKEHPDHPRRVEAEEEAGNESFDQAIKLLADAKSTKEKDPAAAEKLMEDARKAFVQSRPGFVKSVGGYKEVYEKLKASPPKAKGTKAKKDYEDAVEDALSMWLDGRMKVAMVDYYIAQTYTDPKAVKAKEALKTCAKELDSIYQENRGTFVGLLCHLWNGKIEDELGNEALALDIYDEVLAIESDTTDRNATGVEPLLAQAENFRLQVKLRKEGADAYMAEAEEWIKQWEGTPDTPVKKAYRGTDGYQAIALQVVKRQIELAEKAGGSEKAKLTEAARKRLTQMVKVRSESQAEAIKVFNALKGKSSGDGPANVADVKTFDDAFTLAQDALKNQDYEPAAQYFDRALEMTDKVKDAKKLADAWSGWEMAHYAVAVKLYQASKMNEALEEAKKVALRKDNDASQTAPKAGALCVQAILAMYATLEKQEDRDAMLDRLNKAAEFVLARWPDRPEADDVRISQARSLVVQGKYDEGLKLLESVNPRSERRPLADQIAGQLHWRNYAIEKAKPDAQRDNKVVEEERTKAEEQLANSLQAQRKQLGKDEEWPSQLVETELLLGDIHLDKGEFKEAAELFQPVVNEYKRHKPQQLDRPVLRTFTLAVRAYNGLGDFAKSGATAEALLDLGDSDTPDVNAISVNFVRLLAEEYKVVDVELMEQKSSGIPQESTEKKLAGLKENLIKLLDKLAGKQNHTLAGLIYMGDTGARIGNTEIAEKLYKRALEQVDKEREKEKENPQAQAGSSSVLNAIPRIRAQLVGLMIQKGQFAEGVTEIDKLIEEKPNALEPKMVKCRLLQAWAEKDPKHFKEAESAWAFVRNMLSKVRKNPKPPEYYECNYNVALCLWMEFEQTKDAAKADQARKLLHTMISTSPKLSGPEMVVRYKMLLDKLDKALAGANPAGGKPGQAAPNAAPAKTAAN